MTLTITGRHYDVRSSTRAYAHRKLHRLSKITRDLNRMELALGRLGEEFEAELRVHADKGEFIATHRGHYLRSTIDRCVAKLEKQLQRHISRLQDRRRRAGDAHRIPPEALAAEA